MVNKNMSLGISPVQKNISPGWTEADIQNQGRLSDSEEISAFDLDNESKIKPEVELKEETENFVYKADFRGHLQLVSLGQEVSNQCLNQSDSNRQWQDVKSPVPSSETGQITSSWQEESQDSNTSHMYRKCKNGSDSSVEGIYCIKEEPSENSQNCSYGQTIPEIYDYSSDTSWNPEADASSQLTDGNKNMVLLTQAEKKRLYRLRIKAENPAMWSSIKQKEAARKREQREKRRYIILEMQKAMELAGLPESPDVINQKLYLEALKESYPEIWDQLINALPATQLRNEQVYNKQTSKSRRNSPKPAKMYKDVIEAQKKRLYRQRMKEERPEMYERQKARDAYARSIQRLMSKKKQLSDKNGCHSESVDPGDIDKLTYLQNVQMEDDNYVDSKFFSLHLMSPITNQNNSGLENSPGTEVPVAEVPISESGNLPPAADGSTTQSDPSEVCDNLRMDSGKHSENPSISIVSDIPNEEKNKESCEAIHTSRFSENLSSAICSTQSNILWYWNDVKNSQYSEKMSTDSHIPDGWIKRPQVLTEDERLQKILKERMHLKEKRKRYRMNMSAERRTEFLETERERLKAYRLKKKASEASVVYDVDSVSVDQ